MKERDIIAAPVSDGSRKSLSKTGIYFGQTGQPVLVLATSCQELSAPVYEITDPAPVCDRLSASQHLLDKSFVVCLKSFFQLGGKRLIVMPIQIETGVEDLASEYRTKLLGVDGGFGNRTGIHRLRDFEACGDLLAFPQAAVVLGSEDLSAFYQEVQNFLERRSHHFLLMDPPCYTDSEKLRIWARTFQSEMSALFFPWVSVPGLGLTPASILAAALIQRNDFQHSISTTPANQVIDAKLELLKEIPKAEVEALNQVHVNVFRRKPNSDLVLWGAFTTSKAGDHRSLIHLSRSLWSLKDAFERVTESLVLEARTESTCEKIHRSLEAFLENCQREGLLVARPGQKAYRIEVELMAQGKGQWDSGIQIRVDVALESADRFVGLQQEIS
ncbi:MAG: hypothetical protein EA369_07350 [Bradymonadales bacterium]|nr:MAG: hypothetical protein EA369_07350 [Bradymonadales bacterium]